MNTPTNSEALPPTHGSPSSETPRTDAFAQRLTAAKVPASKTWPHWYDYAAALERELAACHKALMICDGAMMGKVKPSSVAFKRINEILRPENAKVDATAEAPTKADL